MLSSSITRHLFRKPLLLNTNSKKLILSRTLATKTSSSGQNKKELRFDGKTAIVTGGGRGLGREYALLLASRGANVVINDFGGSASGELPKLDGAGDNNINKNAADIVVAEIKGLFPQANVVANYDSVSCEKGVKNMVQMALESFDNNKNKIDILINNAGILRDKSFIKMTIDDWDQVCNIHLRGSFLVTHACWPHMRENKYGRIVMTSSTSGLYGNFGQANYSAAKMGLIGLSNTLAIEGASKNVFCNTIVPMASSRMTKDIIPEELAKRLLPSYVAPLVVWLCHADCNTNGAIIEAAGRWFGRHRLERSLGKYLSTICDKTTATGKNSTMELGGERFLVVNSKIEQLSDNWHDICNNFDNTTQVESFADHLANIMKVFELNKDS